MGVLRLAVFCVAISFTSSVPWCYFDCPNVPQAWHMMSGAESCNGSRQSPINIVKKDVEFKPSLGVMSFNQYNVTPTKTMLTNNGRTAEVSFVSNMTVSGGGLPKTYKTLQFHFHWGSEGGPNTEHAIDGCRFPLELHLVHSDSAYQNPLDAFNKPDGLAVNSFLFEISEKDNEALEKHVLSHFSKILKWGSSVEIPAFALDQVLASPADRRPFFRYLGSLTTPNCYESVTWSVMATKMRISLKQMGKFYSLIREGDRQMENNVRPLQRLNNRKVYANHVVGKGATPSPSPIALSILCIITYVWY